MASENLDIHIYREMIFSLLILWIYILPYSRLFTQAVTFAKAFNVSCM